MFLWFCLGFVDDSAASSGTNCTAKGLCSVPKGKKLAMGRMEKISTLDWLHPDTSSHTVGHEVNANELEYLLKKGSLNQNIRK